MGIIKAFGTAVSSAAADQWKECFYCGSMEGGLLQTRGVRMESARSVNRGSSDVITDGSLIIVADGQCAIATESGAITGVYDRPGENIFSSKRSAGIFSKGGVGSLIGDIMSRAQFGGDIVPVTQRLYYINTLEIPGSPFEVNAPIPFRFRDPNTGLDMDGGVFCAGMYSYRIADPAPTAAPSIALQPAVCRRSCSVTAIAHRRLFTGRRVLQAQRCTALILLRMIPTCSCCCIIFLRETFLPAVFGADASTIYTATFILFWE